MAADSDVALTLNLLSAPHLVCVFWRAASLLYWYEATQLGLWDGCGRDLGFLLALVGLSELNEGPVTYFPFNRAAVLTMKVLNQCLLCKLLFLVHTMRERRAAQTSPLHRVGFALLVENCAAFRVTWNYVQAAELASGLFSQALGAGPDALPPLHLALLAVCLLATVSTELVFLRKFRWTFAAHVPIQLWVYSLYSQAALDGKTVCVLIGLNALLVVKKLVPNKCPYRTDVDKQPLALQV